MRKSLLFFILAFWCSFALAPLHAATWKKLTEGHVADTYGLGRLQASETSDGMYIILQYGVTPQINTLLSIDESLSDPLKLCMMDESAIDMHSVWQLVWVGTGSLTNAAINNNQYLLKNYVTGEFLANQSVLNGAANSSLNNVIGVTSDSTKALVISFARCNGTFGCSGPNSGVYKGLAWPSGYYAGGVALVPLQSDGSMVNPSRPGSLEMDPSNIKGPKTETKTHANECNQLKITYWGATRAWSMYEVEVVAGGAAILQALIDTYTEQGTTPSNYKAGNAPGYYGAGEVQEFNEAWAAVQAAIDAGDLTTEEDAEPLQQRLIDAQTAVAASQVPLTDGYYYIASADSTQTTTRYLSSAQSLSTGTSLTYGPLNQSDPAYIFSVQADGDNYVIQNFGTYYYVNRPVDGAAQSLAATTPQQIAGLAAAGQFSLSNTSLTNRYYAAGSGETGSLSLSNRTASNGATAWSFVPVDSSTVSTLTSAAEQLRRNLALGRLIEQAKEEVASTDTVYSVNTADPFITDESQLSTNSPEVLGGQGIENLIDGDVNTYFHTRWSPYTQGEARPTEPDYICAQFADGITGSVSFSFVPSCQRNFPNNYPTKALITASKDSVVWDTIATVNIPVVAQTSTYISKPLLLADNYTYLKFSVLERPNGPSSNGQITMQYSEFNWYESQIDPYRSASMRDDVKDALAQLKAAIATAETVGDAMTADVEAMQTALDEYLAIYPDITPLLQAVQNASDLINNAPVDEGRLGYYNAATIGELETAVSTYGGDSEQLAPLSRAELNSRLAALTAANTKFRWSFNKPEAGKYYRIVSRSVNLANMEMYNTALSVNQGTQTHSLNYDSLITDRAAAYYQFVPASDSTYYLQNAKSGFFFSQVHSQTGNRTNYLTADSLEFIIDRTSAGLFYIHNASLDGTLYAEVSPGNNFVSTHDYSPASTVNNFYWAFEPVEAAEAVTPKQFAQNSIQIVCLPYALSAVPTSEDGSVTLYRLVGVNKDAATGGVSQLKLAIYPDGTLPAAGEPFALEVGNSTFFDAGSTDRATVEFAMAEGTLQNVGGTANGLVGTLRQVQLTGENHGYLQEGLLSQVLEGTPVTISAQSGYFDLFAIEDQSEGISEANMLLIDVNGDPIINGIGRATVAQKELVNVYTIEGVLVRRNVRAADATRQLPAGLYIVGGRKVLVK